VAPAAARTRAGSLTHLGPDGTSGYCPYDEPQASAPTHGPEITVAGFRACPDRSQPVFRIDRGLFETWDPTPSTWARPMASGPAAARRGIDSGYSGRRDAADGPRTAIRWRCAKVCRRLWIPGQNYAAQRLSRRRRERMARQYPSRPVPTMSARSPCGVRNALVTDVTVESRSEAGR
jgi:hypothetical protein